MADDADMRNELSDMQQRADQLADEVRTTHSLHRGGLGCEWAQTGRHAHVHAHSLTETGRQHIHMQTHEKHMGVRETLKRQILKFFNMTSMTYKEYKYTVYD